MHELELAANASARPLATASLADHVYERLREDILCGGLRPGAALRQEEIAQALGVSRAPLREALPRLQAEGLVVLSPRRGYSVATLDPEEIAEIFELRTLIEAHAAGVATRRRSSRDVEHARAVYEEMSALDIPAQMGRWFDQNLRLHEALTAPCDMKRVMRILSNLRATVQPYIRLEMDLTGNVDEANAEHSQLVEAFAAGNAELMSQLTAEHTRRTAARLLQGMNRPGFSRHTRAG